MVEPMVYYQLFEMVRGFMSVGAEGPCYRIFRDFACWKGKGIQHTEILEATFIFTISVYIFHVLA
jgi:hypothetical protein